MKKVAVVNYGSGNLRSVGKALEAVGLSVTVTASPRAVRRASAVVLPGVGAFGDCMKALREKDLIDPIVDSIRAGKPYLGLCLGLQILFDSSDEFGVHKGLGMIPGKVRRFPDALAGKDGRALKVPHMGWNDIAVRPRSPLFKGIRSGSHFYFVHSYYALAERPEDTAAGCTYGLDFTAAVHRDNIYACQFHPEKSQALGLALLRNFGDLV